MNSIIECMFRIKFEGVYIYISWKITPKSIGPFGSKNKKTHTLPQTHRASTKKWISKGEGISHQATVDLH